MSPVTHDLENQRENAKLSAMAIANTVKLQVIGGQLTPKICGWDIVIYTPLYLGVLQNNTIDPVPSKPL